MRESAPPLNRVSTSDYSAKKTVPTPNGTFSDSDKKKKKVYRRYLLNGARSFRHYQIFVFVECSGLEKSVQERGGANSRAAAVTLSNGKEDTDEGLYSMITWLARTQARPAVVLAG